MKKEIGSISYIKAKIEALKGENITMQISRGRKKTEVYNGEISDIFPQVFVVKVAGNLNIGRDKISCSYADVLCGNVCIDKEA